MVGTSVVSEGGRGATATAYMVEVAVPKDAFRQGRHTVLQRFSKFVALHEALVKAWGKHVDLPKLPARRLNLVSSRAQHTRRSHTRSPARAAFRVLPSAPLTPPLHRGPSRAARRQVSALTAGQIDERRAGLEAYLAQLVTVLNWSVEPNLRHFFEAERWATELGHAPRACAAPCGPLSCSRAWPVHPGSGTRRWLKERRARASRASTTAGQDAGQDSPR